MYGKYRWEGRGKGYPSVLIGSRNSCERSSRGHVWIQLFSTPSIVASPLSMISVYYSSSSHQIPRPVDQVEDAEHQRKQSARDDLHHDRLVAGELVPPCWQPARHSDPPPGNGRRRYRRGTSCHGGAVSARQRRPITMLPAAVRLRRQEIDGHKGNRWAWLIRPTVPQQPRLHLHSW